MRWTGWATAAAIWVATLGPASADIRQLAAHARAGDAAAVAQLLEAGVDPDEIIDGYPYYDPPLIEAARAGRHEVMRLLIAGGADLDDAHAGETALFAAVEAGDAVGAALLLKAGASPDAVFEPHLPTPLMRAALSGRADLVRLVLEAGADADHRSEFGDTPLHEAASAARPEIVALLLAAGARPNVALDTVGWTPLHKAASADLPDVARQLIAAGATVDATDHRGRTPLHWAAEIGNETVVAALLYAGADPDRRDNSGETPFIAALSAMRGGIPAGPEAAAMMIERTRDLDAGFAAAVWARHAGVALRLLERGASIDAVDSFGRPAIAGATRHEGPAMLRLFVARGANLDRFGGAALIAAAGAGRADLAERLLGLGIDVESRDERGATALLHAARDGHVEAVRLLIEKGATRDPRDDFGLGVRDYMAVATGFIDAIIDRREASRAWRPTDELRRELDELVARQEEVLALL